MIAVLTFPGRAAGLPLSLHFLADLDSAITSEYIQQPFVADAFEVQPGRVVHGQINHDTSAIRRYDPSFDEALG
mgnify:FL=1